MVKETEKTITILGLYGSSVPYRQEKKDYFRTWAEAHAEVVKRLTNRIDHHENGLADARDDLAKALKMKEPC